MSQREVQAFFDQHAELWDYSFNEDKLEQLRKIFCQYLKPLNSPLLDLGCGTGVLLKIIPEFLPDPASLILELDLSLSMLVHAREKIRLVKQNIALIQADGHQLPISDRSLSEIIAFQVFPHFSNPKMLLSEVFRVLRPTGRFVILHLMNHEQLNAYHKNVNGVVSQHYLPAIENLSSEMSKAGFGIETQIENQNCYLLIARRS